MKSKLFIYSKHSYYHFVLNPQKNILYTVIQTSRKHCRSMPPLDIFFSASSSPKFNELANISTSAMLTNLCKKETATSIGIP